MKKLVIVSWFLLITLIITENLLNVRFDFIGLLLFSIAGASTGLWLGGKFRNWIGPHIWKAIQKELRKPR